MRTLITTRSDCHTYASIAHPACSISQNSDVNFTIIINVDSGPGEAATPNSDYTSAIVKLNEAPNVETVGYVRTNYTDRDINDVLRDIETYSGWSQSNSSLAMSGIFFDETPNDYSLRKQRYLGTANKAVKNSVGIQQPKMVCIKHIYLRLESQVCLMSYADHTQPRYYFRCSACRPSRRHHGGVRELVRSVPAKQRGSPITVCRPLFL